MIKNGLLQIPLFHGTSDIFLPSIEKHGLGGFDILSHYNVLDLLKMIYSEFSKNHENNEWWIMNCFIIEKMLGNSVTAGNFNFRYGSLYLTPSLFTASNYASLNKYGSEFISTFFQGFEELTKLEGNIENNIFPFSHPLREIYNLSPKPVVLEIKNIEATILHTEQGNTIDEQLSQMAEFPETIWQQFNFECSSTIDFNEIEIKYLG